MEAKKLYSMFFAAGMAAVTSAKAQSPYGLDMSGLEPQPVSAALEKTAKANCTAAFVRDASADDTHAPYTDLTAQDMTITEVRPRTLTVGQRTVTKEVRVEAQFPEENIGVCITNERGENPKLYYRNPDYTVRGVGSVKKGLDYNP